MIPLLSRIARALEGWLPPRLHGWLVCARLPRSGIVEVTTACNLDCPLCPTHIVPRSQRYLPRQQVRALVDATRGKLKALCFHLMGEPTVHPELFGIVRDCSERDIETSFSSNGMHLEKHLGEIFDSGLTHLSVDIDGVDASDYGRYRKGGDFVQATQGLRAVLAEKARRGSELPRVQVQTVMFSYNEDREDEVDELHASFEGASSRKKRPSYFYDPDLAGELQVELRPDVEAKQAESAEQFLAQVDHENPRRKWARENQETGTAFRDLPLCPQLRRATVLSDGRVVACCLDVAGTTTFGDLNEESFDTIWRSEQHRRVIEDFRAGRIPLCGKCTLSHGN